MDHKNYITKSVIFLSLLLCLSSGITAQQVISGSFMSNGQNRQYAGAIPDNPVSNLRLVILFCGGFEFGIEMFNRGFDSHLGNNTMVIYPEPFVTGTSFGNPNIANGADDYQMVEDLITHLMSSYSINPNDICIGGFSAGALFSYGLICEFNRINSSRLYKFRAMASVAGAMDASNLNYVNCPLANAVPLIAFHGTTDNLANYYGGDLLYTGNVSANTDTALHYWATTLNSCSSSFTTSALPDLVVEPLNPSTVEFIEYDCLPEQKTHLYRILNGRHYWPGGNASWDISSGRNLDINASELIADFFNSFPGVSVENGDENANKVVVYPNPAKDLLQIKSNLFIKRLDVFNTMGQLILGIDQPSKTIQIDNIPAGIYYVKTLTSSGVNTVKIIKE